MKLNLQNESEASIVIIAIALIAYFLNYILSAYISRQLGSAHYGEYSQALQVLMLVSFLALFGTSSAGKRFLAQYIHNDNLQEATAYIAWNIKFVRRTYIACWLLALVFMIAMLVLHFLGIHDIRKYHLALYMFWLAPIASLATLFSNYLMANNNFVLSTVLQNIVYNLVFILYFFLAFHFLQNQLNNLEITLVLVLVFITLTVISFYFAIKDIKFIRNITFKRLLGENTNTSPEWLKTSVKLALSNLIYLLGSTLVIFLIQIIMHSQSDVGFYSAAMTIGGFLWLLGNSINIPLQPLVSSLINSDVGKQSLQAKLNIINILVVCLLTPILAVIIYYSKTFLHHFGPNYPSAYKLLILIGIGCYLTAYYQSGKTILSYAGFAICEVIVRSITVSIFVIGGIVLLFLYGLIGIGIAYLVYALVNLILTTGFVHKYTGIKMLSFI